MIELVESRHAHTYAPSFGEFLRHLRDDRRLSREGLAKSAGVSASYINHLELGRRDHPTRPVVEALAGRLERVRPLSVDERRYLFDLAGLREPVVPAVAELTSGITPALRRRIDCCCPDPAGYLDSRWHVLALNQAARSAFPGLDEAGNVMRWLLGDRRAVAALADWDRVLDSAVSVLRARIALPGNEIWAADLLDELHEYSEFARRWATGRVNYSSEQSAIRLRDSASGATNWIDLQLYDVDTARYPGWIRMFWCVFTQ
ncbi:MmyB family transcriptional regulator [Nocardia sp. NPDC004582]